MEPGIAGIKRAVTNTDPGAVHLMTILGDDVDRATEGIGAMYSRTGTARRTTSTREIIATGIVKYGGWLPNFISVNGTPFMSSKTWGPTLVRIPLIVQIERKAPNPEGAA